MRVLLMGANPFVTLFRDGAAVAFASVWRVDWSPHGKGRALVFGDHDGVRVLGPDPELGQWLAGSFNRHLTRVLAGLPWRTPEPITVPVEFDLDLNSGFVARAGDITVELADPIDRQLTRNDAYDLGGVPHVLSTVWIPCRRASITVGGTAIDGECELAEAPDDPYSSAAIAEAEVWCSLE